jgi:hypothetical protein
MLALNLYRSYLCPRCHHDMRESMDPGNDGRYMPKLPTRCHACDALALSQERYKNNDRPQALFHHVELKPRG